MICRNHRMFSLLCMMLWSNDTKRHFAAGTNGGDLIATVWLSHAASMGLDYPMVFLLCFDYQWKNIG